MNSRKKLLVILPLAALALFSGFFPLVPVTVTTTSAHTSLSLAGYTSFRTSTSGQTLTFASTSTHVLFEGALTKFQVRMSTSTAVAYSTQQLSGSSTVVTVVYQTNVATQNVAPYTMAANFAQLPPQILSGFLGVFVGLTISLPIAAYRMKRFTPGRRGLTSMRLAALGPDFLRRHQVSSFLLGITLALASLGVWISQFIIPISLFEGIAQALIGFSLFMLFGGRRGKMQRRLNDFGIVTGLILLLTGIGIALGSVFAYVLNPSMLLVGIALGSIITILSILYPPRRTVKRS